MFGRSIHREKDGKKKKRKRKVKSHRPHKTEEEKSNEEVVTKVSSPVNSIDSVPSPSKRQQRQSQQKIPSPTHSNESIPSPRKTHENDNKENNSADSNQHDTDKKPLNLSLAAHGVGVRFNEDNEYSFSQQLDTTNQNAGALHVNSNNDTLKGLEWFEKPHLTKQRKTHDLNSDGSYNSRTSNRLDFNNVIAETEQIYRGINAPKSPKNGYQIGHDENSSQSFVIVNHRNDDKVYKTRANDDDWFSLDPRSAGSSQSRDSFTHEVIERLLMEPEIVAVCAFEDEIHERLRENIVGKWTRRFVQKRTKPKVLNSLHKQRLEVLQTYVGRDRTAWKDRESIYVNLSLRLRLHEEACGLLVPLIDTHHSFDQSLRDQFSEMSYFLLQISENKPENQQSKHHQMFVMAIEKMFGHRFLVHGFESFGDEENLASTVLPDVAVVEVLQRNLSNALSRLESKMWESHDKFKVIDDEIDVAVDGLIDHFAQFEQNPLIQQNVLNFPEAMLRLLRIVQSSNHQKRILSRLMPQMLPDFEQIEGRSTDVVIRLLHQWCNYIMSLNSYSFDEWNKMVAEQNEEDNLNLQQQHDSIVNSMSIVKSVFDDGDDFVQDEIPEIDRLSETQVIVESEEVALSGANSVERTGAFADLIDDCEIDYYDESEIEQCSAVTTRQGVIFFYRYEDDPFLTVKINSLTNIHAQKLSHEIILQDLNNSVSVRFRSQDQFQKWKGALMSFCV